MRIALSCMISQIVQININNNNNKTKSNNNNTKFTINNNSNSTDIQLINRSIKLCSNNLKAYLIRSRLQ